MRRLTRSFRSFAIAAIFVLVGPIMIAEAQTCSTINAITGQSCIKLTKNYEYNPTEHWWGYFFSNSCGRSINLEIRLQNGRRDFGQVDKFSDGKPGVFEGDCTDNCGGVASYEVKCHDVENPRPAAPIAKEKMPSVARPPAKSCSADKCIAGCSAYDTEARSYCESSCAGAVAECYGGGPEPKTPEYTEDEKERYAGLARHFQEEAEAKAQPAPQPAPVPQAQPQPNVFVGNRYGQMVECFIDREFNALKNQPDALHYHTNGPVLMCLSPGDVHMGSACWAEDIVNGQPAYICAGYYGAPFYASRKQNYGIR
jgi:hypothetical protein